ncbi:MAG: FG-GAP repeat domain-containing protein [Kofleriaceae bacterium]
MRRIVALFLLSSCGEVQGDMPGDGSTTSDAGDDAAPETDAPPAACGDGVRNPGEACFGTPFSLDGGDSAREAQFADVDGDGDLDLLFATGTQLSYFPQQSGTFATTPSDGPPITGSRFRAANIGGDARLELIGAGTGSISTWQTSGTSTAYTSTVATTEVSISPAGVELAKITNSATPEVVSAYGDKIFLGTYNTNMVLTNVSDRGVVKISALATGALDSDAFDDVAIAAVGGIVVFRGTSTGLDTVITTPQLTSASGIAIGDLDADGVADLIFAKSGTSGSLNWMRGLGNMTFAAVQTKAIANLAGDIVVTDIDGDGRVDVIGGRSRGTLAVLVFHGKSDGTFTDPVELPYPFATMSSISANADYNGDGVADIVTTVSSTGEIAVYPSWP